MLEGLENYRILLSGLFAWWLAQFLKVPFEYMVTRHWNWALMVQHRRHALIAFRPGHIDGDIHRFMGRV
jgi:hypothetical protein